MEQYIRAVYENGQLRPLDTLALEEGQVVNISIQTDDTQAPLTPDEVESRLRAAGLLVELDIPEGAVALTPDERERIGRLFIGDVPSEELIDEDRGLY